MSGKRPREEDTAAGDAAKAAKTAAAGGEFELEVGAYANKGLKSTLEDVEKQVHDLSPHGAGLEGLRSAFYAIYDGHAGRIAADYAAEHLHVNIASRVAAGADNEGVRKAIFEGFKETDERFLALAAEKNHKDGCCAVTATIVRDIIFVAWVGDSRAVLARRETEDPASRVKALTVTKEHTCIIAKERDRIVKHGGFVENNRVDGIMEVSRSIGDMELKKHGVISTPQIERVTICARDEFLLLGCDGLWRVFDPKDAVQFCRQRLQEGMPPEKVCMEVVREAIRVRQAHDNVSAVLIRITKR